MNLTTAELRQAIKENLAVRNMSAYELMETTGAPKSTMYKVLRDMVDEGDIRNSTPYRSRNAVYALGASNGPNTIIPSMVYKGESYKSSFFLQVEREVTDKIFEDVFLSLARLMKAAERLNDGASLEQTELILRRCKAKLIEARTDLQELLSVADQILNEPRFWNPIFLEKFHKDATWRPEYHNDLIGKYSSKEE